MESSTDNIEELNETGHRSSDRRQSSVDVVQDRRKVQRRRLIDPTTCERDYTNDEIEFMQAMDEYKRRSGRMFPTCSEILEVLRGMGYVRLDVPVAEHSAIDNPNGEEELVRNSDSINGDLDQLDELEDGFDEEEFEDEYDDE